MTKVFKLPVVLAIMSMNLMGLCHAAANSDTTTMSYTSSEENFTNPERGFYVSMEPIGNKAISPLELSELQKIRNNNISLVRKYYLLSDFRNKPISQSFLEMISNDCQTARKAGVKLIVRFTYNWLGGGDDASANVILSHLDQLKPLLEANYDVIAYMEAGFIGNWGEWHKSSNNHVDSWTLDANNNAKNILHKLLSVLPNQRMVALRYFKHKKQILGSDPLSSTEAFNSSFRARTGHHNDAFRAGVDDMGTYSYVNPVQVAQEKAWLNLDTRYVVQSGEPAGVASSLAYTDCKGTLADLAQMHWSAMSINQSDSTQVYQKWQTQGCMEEIKRRLGYRFRLLNSTVPNRIKPGSTFSMKFTVVNDGWASPYNPRRLEVILRHTQTGQEYYLPVAESLRRWTPGVTTAVNVEGNLPNNMAAGDYQVLLNLPDPHYRLRNRPDYSIRLANKSVWEPSTGYNSLLQNVRVDATATASPYSAKRFFAAR
ncbi:hypothetical protein Glo7428_4396 [Gloeocapsa sp. PCC 7428]|uniref:DUF4832 domain-containing protein n=1 Tax=Gloeocapsa sp. PCC 7428 TaxID=1173026 RepID=UPI0002A5F221|nr:DUF4832 domain-containing protein [Gloeocapsa sp. PCC 7428]AFZ32839.1 hypothetical protein Glo7428_4396 [Gloeocapsa sp. PCC 7428]